MTHEIKGVLYGHYDSRGGSTFVESSDGRTPTTDALYAESFCCEGWDFGDGRKISKEQQAKQLCDDDFLGTATIRSEAEIQNGQDIEYDDNALPVWVKETTDPSGRYAEHYEIQHGGECPEGYKESELGEDAFGIIVMRHDQGEKSEE